MKPATKIIIALIACVGIGAGVHALIPHGPASGTATATQVLQLDVYRHNMQTLNQAAIQNEVASGPADVSSAAAGETSNAQSEEIVMIFTDQGVALFNNQGGVNAFQTLLNVDTNGVGNGMQVSLQGHVMRVTGDVNAMQQLG